MREAARSKIIAGDAGEGELLAACRDGSDAAAERLVDLHVRSGVTAARRLALPSVNNAALLDLVHDAFITAFDEALDGKAAGIALPFFTLVRRFAQDAGQSAPDGDDAAPISQVISAQDMRQLRLDLIREVRVMVEIHAESPQSRGLAQRLLAELRILRRRIHARADAVRSRLPAAVVAGDP